MLFVAFFYYQNEKTLYIDFTKSNMQNITSKASNEVIVSHMMGLKFDKDKYLNSNDYKISFYNSKKEKLFGNLEDKINFDIKSLQDDKSIIIVDNSTVGHLGIEYIVLKDETIVQKIDELKYTILGLFLISYSFIAIIGFYLAKLLLKPIKGERVKLNNFIKDTTHELNTPISAIMMSSENENLTPKQIERIRLSANRISEIYKDLTYLFLENKEKPKDIEKIDLASLIKEQIESFEPLYLKKRLDVTVNINKFIYEINKDDFIRLFNNLFSNAIKYNKMGGKIDVNLQENILIIKDSGIGINKDKIKDIYKRYYRATEQSGGFGLGLNIVNMICKRYDIKINVESIEKEGTTFKLTF